jgi:hypothetical protein
MRGVLIIREMRARKMRGLRSGSTMKSGYEA